MLMTTNGGSGGAVRALTLSRALGGWQCVPVELTDGMVVRVVGPNDVDQRYPDGLNDPVLRRFLAPSGSQQTLASVRAYVDTNLQARDAVLVGLFVRGQLVGTSRIHDITRGAAWVGIAIFDGGYRGKGLGKKLLAAASEIAINQLGVHRLFAGIDRQNAASLALFGACGFGRYLRSTASEIWVRSAADDLLQTQYDVERYRRLADSGQSTQEDVVADLASAASQFSVSLSDAIRRGFEVANSISYHHPGLNNASYLRHCLRVLELYGGWVDEPCESGVSLALLHNALEVAGESVWSNLPADKEVVAAVKVLTVNRELQWDAAYKAAYYSRISDAPNWVGQIKILDKMDNLFILGLNRDDEIRHRYLAEIEMHVISLARTHLPHAERYLQMMVENARRLGHFTRTADPLARVSHGS